ncbi:MAG: glycosyltransferase [Chthoniobacteraceae bacterium]
MKTRVLHIIDSFDLGGAQTALLNLVRATDRERFEPEVAAMHGRGVFFEDFRALGVPVHSLSPRKWLPVYLPRLASLILRRKPRILHCHLFGSNWIAKPLAALLGVPVRINHDQCNDALRYEKPWARWLDTWTNRFSSHVCAVSASTRDFLVKRECLAPGRVSLVYNGVDLARFDPPARKPRLDRFVVLGVGRLHSQKNFALFLEVAAELTRRGHAVEFRLAGTGPEEAALRTKARELGIGDRVQFLGHVHETPPLFAGADALLMTSKFEGTPLTLLEAMAMRLPIVAPRLDGIGEILRNEEDALLVEPPERDDFVRSVERLIHSADFSTRLADAAHVKVRERFSAEAMAAQVEAIYERCLNP